LLNAEWLMIVINC